MNKFLKEAKRLLKQGFASAAEKSALVAMFKELGADEQETVQPDKEQVEALPEQSPSEEGAVAASVRSIVNAHAATAVAELKQIGADIKSEVETWLKAHKDLAEKKSGIYHPDVQEKTQRLSKYMREFMSATLDGDVDGISKLNGGMSRKELTTDDSGSPYGGYVVDRELSAEIRHLIKEYGVARREFTGLQLSKNSYAANTLVTDVTVYWVDEAAAIKSTQVVLGQSTLELKKLAAIVTLTRELLEDQEVDLFSFIAQRVANAFANAEDTAFFDGDGTSTYGGFTGLLRNANVNTVTLAVASTFSSLDADDLLDMQDATHTQALANGKYYMHRTVLSHVRKLKDDNNNYIYQNPGQGQPATIWNKPVVLVEAMPAMSATAASKAFILFGDLKLAAIFGYKGAISADRFNAGVVRNVADNADINLITTDREAIRWVERVGALAILPTAVTRLRTGAAS